MAKTLVEIFDNTDLNVDETLKVFSNIIASGFVKQTGGWYAEKAEELIQEGYLNDQGAILVKKEK